MDKRILIDNYYNYISTLNYLSSLPKWRFELFFYESKRPITLAPSDMKTAKKCFDNLPPLFKGNRYSLYKKPELRL